MGPGNRVTSASSSTSVLADPPVIRAFRHRFFVWIALLAMLVSALAPALRRAVGPDDRGRYVVAGGPAVATSGVAWPADEAAFYGAHTTPADDGGEGRALDDCAYCSAPCSTAMLPPGDPTPVFA